MLIFPRARLTEQLKKGAPPDTIFCCNSSGWMTVMDFNAWFDHFLKQTRPSLDSPVLLLLDGHVSHTKNLFFIEKARECHVTVISLPPHCSQRLQPLDVSFMGPFKTNFSKAVECFLKDNPGKVVTLNEISSLVGLAFMQASRATTAVNGLRKTGVVPFNRFIFNDADFAPSDVSDIPICEEDPEPPFLGFEDETNMLSPLPSIPSAPPTEPLQQNILLQPVIEPKTSSLLNQSAASTEGNVLNQLTPKIGSALPLIKPGPLKELKLGAFNVPPSMIRPLPKSKAKRRTRINRMEKSTNITASPYRSALKLSQATRDIGQLKKDQKIQERASKTGSETPKRKRGRPKGVRKQQLVILLQDSLCDICGACFSFSENGQGWQKCNICHMWNHECNGGQCHSCNV